MLKNHKFLQSFVIKTIFWRSMPWVIALVCVLVTIHMGRQYNRVCTHIMNINDGMYESNATIDAKNRESHLASLCFISGFDEKYIYKTEK
tara:strand:+ start:37 stop:306 length:270 start_codon:yes stop_codon:yes gene_type:complete